MLTVILVALLVLFAVAVNVAAYVRTRPIQSDRSGENQITVPVKITVTYEDTGKPTNEVK